MADRSALDARLLTADHCLSIPIIRAISAIRGKKFTADTTDTADERQTQDYHELPTPNYHLLRFPPLPAGP